MCKLSFTLLTLASISQWYQHKGARAIILLKQNCRVLSLLLGSMFFWSCLIQLNRSYKNNGKFARTGIATLNSHISKPVALHENLKNINCNYFLILGIFFAIFGSYAAIFGNFLGVKKENLLLHHK